MAECLRTVAMSQPDTGQVSTRHRTAHVDFDVVAVIAGVRATRFADPVTPRSQANILPK
jgi:hypothetical protein